MRPFPPQFRHVLSSSVYPLPPQTWRRSQPTDRLKLVEQPLRDVSTAEEVRWAALFAAVVEQLCYQENLPPPAWTRASRYYLPEPWYAGAKTERMHRLYEETTPDILKQHNIMVGDRLLQRV